MNSTTTLPNVSSSRVLDIDGMSGDACVQKVNTALNGVHGVTAQQVKVGCATFGADQPAYDAARAAIGVAGFKFREGAVAGDAPAGTPGTLKATPVPTGHEHNAAPATAASKPANGSDAKDAAKRV